MSGIANLAKLYFDAGYSYEVIVRFLDGLHGIHMSLRTLKRLFRRLGLKRRLCPRNVRVISDCIQFELTQSGSLLGYRAMHLRLQQIYGLKVSREEVRLLLKVLDPVGVATRKKRRLNRRIYQSKGPNYCWHIDGNDKLLPYGFAIHGCPKRVRADRGTENAKIAFLQPFLRRDESAFLYGKSVNNQRIERFWGSVYQWCTGFWIDLFKSLRHEGYYDDTDIVQRDCLKYAFMELIQKDLDRMKSTWNSHRIRNNKVHANGIPDYLYYLPGHRGLEDYSLVCDDADLDLCYQHARYDKPVHSTQFTTLVEILVNEEGLQAPTNAEEALNMYFDLLDLIC